MLFKKRQEILFLILILVTLNVSVLAEEVNLGLNEALTTALEQNLELKKAELNLEKAELEYEKRQADNLMQQSRYSQKQSEYSFKQAQNSFQNAKYQVINNIVSQYKSIWTSELDLEIKEKQLLLEEMKMQNARAQYEIGDLGSIDLLEQENTFKDTKNNLDRAQDRNEQSLRLFKSALKIDEEMDLVLNKLNCPDIWEITEEEVVEIAFENSIELKLMKDSLELVKINLERAELSSSELDKKINEIELELAGIEKEETKEELLNSIKEEFFQFKQTVKTLELSRERLAGAEEKYSLSLRQHDVGLITQMDLIQYEINMLQARYNYWTAIGDYYQQELSLKQASNLKTEVFEDDLSQKEN